MALSLRGANVVVWIVTNGRGGSFLRLFGLRAFPGKNAVRGGFVPIGPRNRRGMAQKRQVRRLAPRAGAKPTVPQRQCPVFPAISPPIRCRMLAPVPKPVNSRDCRSSTGAGMGGFWPKTGVQARRSLSIRARAEFERGTQSPLSIASASRSAMSARAGALASAMKARVSSSSRKAL